MARRCLTAGELSAGRRAGVAARLERQRERMAFETAFCEYAEAEGTDAAALRVELVGHLVRSARGGKGWAMELCLSYLFGRPKADMRLEVEPPHRPEIVDIPPDIEAELRRLQLELRTRSREAGTS